MIAAALRIEQLGQLLTATREETARIHPHMAGAENRSGLTIALNRGKAKPHTLLEN